MKRTLPFLMVLCLAGCPRPASTPRQQRDEVAPLPTMAPSPSASPDPTTTAKERQAYPYQECDFCVKYLKDRLGEPDSFQAIKWERHVAKDSKWKEPDGQVAILVDFRAKNAVGGWSVDGYVFYFAPDGKFIGANKIGVRINPDR